MESVGMGEDDKVMVIVKGEYEWWVGMVGVEKLGGVGMGGRESKGWYR